MVSDGNNTKLGIWLTFAGTVVAALIGGVFVLLAARNGDASGSGREPAAQQTTRAPASDVGATGAVPTGSPSTGALPAGAGAQVRWQGKLAVQQELGSRRDLDQNPPRMVEPSRAGDFFVWGVTSDGNPYGMVSKAPEGTATIAIWTGSGAAPDYGPCHEAAIAQGVGEVRVVNGTVLCVRTGEGRTARLTAKVDDRSHTITFDAVVWESTE